MKRKGFTLIELLAVIVVLAVIALITVPTVLGVIEKSRKSSYKASMYGIINAADIYLTENLGKVSKNEEIVFTCDGVKCSNSEGDKLSFKGEVPKSGSIYIKGNGTVTVESVYNGRYYANTIDDDIEITEEDTSLTRAELTQLVKSLQQEVNQLKNQIQQSNQNTSSITNLKNQHESDITSIWNKVGKEDLSSIGNGSISKILISQNELINNLNNIITNNQNSVSNLTNQLNTINTKLDSKANSTHSHTFDEITNKPDTYASAPTGKIINLGIPSTGSTYVAPADGYYYLSHIDGYTAIVSLRTYFSSASSGYGTGGNYVSCMLPVKSGETVQIWSNDTVRELYFIYNN